jgi:transcription elongation factor GreA
MSNKIPFTADAYRKLQEDQEKLLTERTAVMGRLQTAREMGDLSENGAYQYAKFELGSLNRQLRQIEHYLEYGEVVAKSDNTDTAEFGTTVTLAQGEKEITYLLVSLHESNPKEGKLSLESPIGQAIKGKKVGDVVKVTVPAGVIEYTIRKIA